MSNVLLDCKFCLKFSEQETPATYAAPQYDGGDTDQPCVWVPVCDYHFDGWYDNVDECGEDRLPAFKIGAPSEG